jgi:hypothetical protein
VLDLLQQGQARVVVVAGPRNVAASRCVRKAWLAVVDAHRLLLPHVLPHLLHGLYINYIDYKASQMFARPSERPAIGIGFLQDYHEIVGHCNGLLLCRFYLLSPLVVANPATRRWDFVDWPTHDDAHPYLVFDPAASSHYQVFSIPNLSQRLNMPVNGKFSGSYGLVKLFSLPASGLGMMRW